MPQFLVKRGKLSREGKVYKTGEKVDLPQEIADRMSRGMLEQVPMKTRGDPVPMKPQATSRTTPPDEEEKDKEEPRDEPAVGKRRGR